MIHYSPVWPARALADALRRLLAAYPAPRTRAQIEAWNAAQRALEVWAVSLRNPDVNHSLREPD